MAKQVLAIRMEPGELQHLKRQADEKNITVSELALDRITVNDHFASGKEAKIKELETKVQVLTERLERTTGKKLPKKYSVTIGLTEPEYLQLVSFAERQKIPKSAAFRQMVSSNQPMLV